MEEREERTISDAIDKMADREMEDRIGGIVREGYKFTCSDCGQVFWATEIIENCPLCESMRLLHHSAKIGIFGD